MRGLLLYGRRMHNMSEESRTLWKSCEEFPCVVRTNSRPICVTDTWNLYLLSIWISPHRMMASRLEMLALVSSTCLTRWDSWTGSELCVVPSYPTEHIFPFDVDMPPQYACTSFFKADGFFRNIVMSGQIWWFRAWRAAEGILNQTEAYEVQDRG